MDLPVGIEQEILEYLHLECGEDRNAPSWLQLEEIQYDGVYEISGIQTHYFKYGERRWATIEPFGDSYVIGMTTKPPMPITKRDIYKSLRISFLNGSPSLYIDLDPRGDGCFGFSDYRDVIFPDSTLIRVLVEVTSHHAPVSVVLAIEEGENDIYVRGSVGLSMSYKTLKGEIIFLTVGTGPWE